LTWWGWLLAGMSIGALIFWIPVGLLAWILYAKAGHIWLRDRYKIFK
jgi:hypothetical protein